MPFIQVLRLAKKKTEVTSFHFRLLRPELLKRFNVPLSSDAYSPMGFHDEKIHHKEVDQATTFMKNEMIVELCEALTTLTQHHVTKEQLLASLVYETHKFGVNMRYLGLVRQKVSEPDVKSILLLVI